MNADSLMSDSPILSAYLYINSTLELEEVGIRIASRLVPGLSFGGKEENIRDENPAIFVKGVLGCLLVLDGDSQDGYSLSLEPCRYFRDGTSLVSSREVDLSGLFLYLLIGLEGIEAEIPPPVLPLLPDADTKS